MTPITPRQKVLIVNAFRKIFKSNDINDLTPPAYKFIYQSIGFIAHYNLYGFREAYQDVAELKRDILTNQQANRWSNFYPGEVNYDYYRSKGDVYGAIVRLLQPAQPNTIA